MTDDITLRRIVRAPRARVFDAWTKAEHLRQWWGPGPVTCPEAEVDLREGGQYRIANREEDGNIIWIEGAFERVERPSELVYSWSIGDGGAPSRVTVRFAEHPEGTELTLTHERIASDAIRENHLMGWNGCLDKLEAYAAGLSG